jgi:hypothetical protein
MQMAYLMVIPNVAGFLVYFFSLRATLHCTFLPDPPSSGIQVLDDANARGPFLGLYRAPGTHAFSFVALIVEFLSSSGAWQS